MLYLYEKKFFIKILKRKESLLYKIKFVYIIYWIVNLENYCYYYWVCIYFILNLLSFIEYLKGIFVLK